MVPLKHSKDFTNAHFGHPVSEDPGGTLLIRIDLITYVSTRIYLQNIHYPLSALWILPWPKELGNPKSISSHDHQFSL